jgi:hypothetical protein
LKRQRIFPRDTPSPIFILGNQKSGTSVIAGLVGAATERSTTIDLKQIDDYHSVPDVWRGNQSLEDFIERHQEDFSRNIVKEPALSFFYPRLVAHYPASKFVFVFRDPRANIRSIFDRLSLSGKQQTISDVQWQRMPPAWTLIVDSRWLGVTGCSPVEWLAGRWNYLAKMYLKHEQQVLLCRYEDFVADKVGTIRSVVNRLGLNYQHDVSPEVDRQYQSRGANRGVSYDEFFGKHNLSVIENICGENMKKLGYEL